MADQSPSLSIAAPREISRAFVTGGAGFLGGHLLARLREEGVETVAMARSPASADRVAKAGAWPFRGDLHDADALAAAMTGCDTVFHLGSYLADWNLGQAMYENVQGGLTLLEAARRAGVRRIVYVSGTGVMVGSGPVVNADENRPRGRPVGVLSASRVRSEAEMLAQGEGRPEVVVARFPYVWGPGETLTPALAPAVRSNRFRWINGGRHKISTLHVQNAVQGLILAARKGRPGQIYWFTDGEVVTLKAFYGAHIEAAGLPAPQGEMSFSSARRLAGVLFVVWRLLGRRNPPPLTPTLVRFMGQEITVNDAKARQELGYTPTMLWSRRSPEDFSSDLAHGNVYRGSRADA